MTFRYNEDADTAPMYLFYHLGARCLGIIVRSFGRDRHFMRITGASSESKLVGATIERHTEQIREIYPNLDRVGAIDIGDRVRWNLGAGECQGVVIERETGHRPLFIVIVDRSDAPGVPVGTTIALARSVLTVTYR